MVSVEKNDTVNITRERIRFCVCDVVVNLRLLRKMHRRCSWWKTEKRVRKKERHPIVPIQSALWIVSRMQRRWCQRINHWNRLIEWFIRSAPTGNYVPVVKIFVSSIWLRYVSYRNHNKSAAHNLEKGSAIIDKRAPLYWLFSHTTRRRIQCAVPFCLPFEK